MPCLNCTGASRAGEVDVGACVEGGGWRSDTHSLRSLARLARDLFERPDLYGEVHGGAPVGDADALRLCARRGVWGACLVIV